MGIITSMWFRNREEIVAVKALLAEIRGTEPAHPRPTQQRRKRVMPVVAEPLPESKPAPKPVRPPVLPRFLTDVMNGLWYPNQEDLTREEQRILYDPAINGLVNEYRATKSPATALMIEERLKEIRG